MAESEVIRLPEPEPEELIVGSVEVDPSGVRFTPNELRALKAESGRTFTELTGPDADDADRMQALGWLAVRRDGRPMPWAAAAELEIVFRSPEDAAPDPTPTEP